MIFSLDRAALLCAFLERISGFPLKDLLGDMGRVALAITPNEQTQDSVKPILVYSYHGSCPGFERIFFSELIYPSLEMIKSKKISNDQAT